MTDKLEWIIWSGGSRPVEPHTLVWIKRRNGQEVIRPAASFCWRHMTTVPAQDIVAYRVLTL